MITGLGVVGVTMSEDGKARYWESKTVYEERELVENCIPRQPNIRANGRLQFLANGNFSVGSV